MNWAGALKSNGGSSAEVERAERGEGYKGAWATFLVGREKFCKDINPN